MRAEEEIAAQQGLVRAVIVNAVTNIVCPCCSMRYSTYTNEKGTLFLQSPHGALGHVILR